MHRVTLLLWVVSLFLLVAMTGMYLGGVGVLAGSAQQRFVVLPGNVVVPDDGKAGPSHSPPLTLTVCTYWEGFRVHKVAIPDSHPACPWVHR